MQGTVVYYDNDRGYGFIEQDENRGRDMFFHHSDCEKVPPLYSRVRYEVKEGRKGPEAANVCII